MRKLKIGIFLDSYFPNVDGVVMVVDNLAKCLAEFCDVTVIVPRTSSEKHDSTRPYKVIRIDSIPVPTTEYRLGVPDLKIISNSIMFKKIDFDIIHIHSPFSIGRLGLRVAKENKIPVIATMHTRFDFEFKKYMKADPLVKLAVKEIIKVYNRCNDCIAVNKALVDVYKDYGYEKEPLVIYNGTDMTLVDNKKEAIDRVNDLYNIDKDDQVFLFVGRIISIKNIFFTLDVLKRLKDDGVKFKMLYVGTGPDEEELKQKIKEYDMKDQVILTGKVTERELLKAIYYRAKLFIFPSLFDASSLVQIEAASQQTPAIFIEGAVTADTVTNNVNGFTAPNDVDLFADRILQILDDKELYESVKMNAYKDLSKSWETIAKETYDLYIKEIEKYIKDDVDE